MSAYKLFVFGPPRLEYPGPPITLRKALALLVYLAVTGQPQSRDTLATLLWPESDQREARASLRRTLYRLTQALGERVLNVEGDTVRLHPEAPLLVDYHLFQTHVTQGLADPPNLEHLTQAANLHTDEFLAGFTLEDSPAFDEWQFFEREQLCQTLTQVLDCLIQTHQSKGEWDAAISYARRWVALDPLHEPAHRALMRLYAWAGQQSAALRQYSEVTRILDSELDAQPDAETVALYETIRARRLASPIPPPPPVSRAVILPPSTPQDLDAPPVAAIRRDQQIRFCTAPDGVRIAYATVGQGPVLVKAANWLSHLEYDWHSPVWRHWIEALSRQRTLVRYDERGCGLSDWNVDQFSLDAWVQDLELVVDTLGVERFPLLGISQGGPVAVAYAVRHPERVSHLILYGTYARGRRKRELTPDQAEEADTLLQLMRVGWGRDNPAFRQVFTTLFMPEATKTQVQSFNELQRVSTSPENAVKFRLAFGRLDVQLLAPQVTTPTLVLHAHADSVVPVEEGRRLAALIPGARFVLLEGQNHILLENEPAWPKFLAEVEQFLQQPSMRQATPSAPHSQRHPRHIDAAPPAHSLPVPLTPFIGREKELADVQRLLADPDCRLVTLVGPGGIGKTRLARELVSVLASDFPHGAHFVPLASVNAPDRIVSAIAESLGAQFHGQQSPEAQLLEHLGDKRLLLALDNMEHLLTGADLIAAILSRTPHVKLLVTSRERLNLQAEWSYEVRGMDYPTPPQIALLRLALEEAEHKEPSITRLRNEIEHFSAVRLFVQRARQAQASFTLSPADLPHVVHLCQLMDGMPLGLELAATWVRSMSCQEIVQEVERNLDFLAAPPRYAPDRHRSLRAIFEQTWQRLSSQEQAVFSQLSVFQGHCTRAAATAVTQATLHDLSALVDKALVRRDQPGHYTMHDLIRHFAAEQLQAQPDLVQQTQARFIAFYAAFLHQRTADLKGRRQLETIAEIAADIDNIRAAWRQAIAERDYQALAQAAECVWIFSEYRGALYECEADFRRAVEVLSDTSSQPSDLDTANHQNLLGSLTAMQGMLRARQGDLDYSRSLVEQGLRLLQTARPYDKRLEANARMYLGYVHLLSGNHKLADECAQRGLALYVEVGDRWGMGRCLQLLGNAAWISGDANRAVQHLQACLALCREIGDSRGSIYTYTGLANVALAHGSYTTAEEYLNQAYSLCQDFHDRIGQAQSLLGLSQLARAQGQASLAIQRSQQALAVYEAIGYKQVAPALYHLGAALRLNGDLQAAHRIFQTSLEGARARGYPVAIAMCLSEMGCLAYDQGHYSQAAEHLREALGLWERLGNEPEAASVHRYLGHVGVALEAEQPRSSRSAYRMALDLALKHDLAPVALDVFVGVAQLAARAGDLNRAVELLALVERQPASTHHTRTNARQRLVELASSLSNDRLTTSQPRGQGLDWQSTAQQLIESLSSSVPQPSSTPTLPIPPTPFIGREKELADVRKLLADPDCRLVTLVGPGGIGKTRLALEIAAAMRDEMPQGAYFVALASVGAPDLIVSAIAEMLAFQFHGAKAPQVQLLDYLRDKKALLVLDNFEHLLDGAEVVAAILRSAPHVKILATSRERLNLQEEWAYEVVGMDYPSPPQLALLRLTPTATPLEHRLTAFSALRLFMQYARQARATFDLSVDDLPHVTRLCQLLDGMPLALELAAPWVRSMTCHEIVQEVERNLDFLATSLRHIPERHRSLRVIFEQTWQRLPEAEQGVLARMSIFRGGCLREAAETVAAASLPRLASLVDKALVRRTPQGRFEMHEWVRQMAAERLQVDPEVYTETANRHSAYYTDFMYQRREALRSNRQKAALEEMAAEIDNLRAAWQWAVARRQTHALSQACESLWHYCEIRGALTEGEAAFRAAVAAYQPTTDDAARLLGELLAAQGWLAHPRGALSEGAALIEQGVALLRGLPQRDSYAEATALMHLGFIRLFQSNTQAAKRCAEEARALYSQLGDDWGVAKCYHILGAIASQQGQTEPAERYLQDAVRLLRRVGDARSRLYVTHRVADLAIARGAWTQADESLNEAYTTSTEIGDLIGKAHTLGLMSRLALLQGDADASIRHGEAALHLYENMGYSRLSNVYSLLGAAWRRKQDLTAAEAAYRRGIETGQAAGYGAGVAYCTRGLAMIMADRQAYDQAERLFREALAGLKRLNLDLQIPTTLRFLGHTLLEQGPLRLQEAREVFAEALRLAEQHGLAPVALDVFVGVARLYSEAGDTETALELLALAEYHPASAQATRDKARPLLTRLTADIPDSVAQARLEAGRTQDWLATATRLAATLTEPVATPPAAPPVSQPMTGSAFIGREQELNDIRMLLRDPTCRLVTVMGPGGIGKTSLALEIAQQLRATWRHGAYVVPLAPLTDTADLIAHLAEHIGLRFFQSSDPQHQVLDYLRDKEMLLVLDNFEHLLTGAGLVAEILNQAPYVKLLVTSRERLNLNSETVYTLGGMTFPDHAPGQNPLAYGAVQLLIQQARRTRPDLDLRSLHLDAIVRICQLVQGMPLALVLAARWLEVLSFEEIADEIAQSLNILESQTRDMPERQRSVRATFELSWKRLSTEEQAIFTRLSVFRGGFTRYAAQAVAGAGLRVLRLLVNKSFIQPDTDGRYAIHELLRQYGAEHLTASGDVDHTHAAHSQHYLGGLAQLEADLKGRRQVEALDEIEADLENIRAAWHWALDHRDFDAMAQAAESLHLFFYMRGRYWDGAQFFQVARERLETAPMPDQTAYWGRIAARQGVFQSYFPATPPQVEADIKTSLRYAQAQRQPAEEAFCLFALGFYYSLATREYAPALTYFEQSLEHYTALNDSYYMARVLHRIGYCHEYFTGSDASQTYTQRSLDLARQTGNKVDALLCLGNLATRAFGLGEYDTATAYSSEALALAGELRRGSSQAHAKTQLGLAYFLQGDWEQVQAITSEGLTEAMAIHYALPMAYAWGVLSLRAGVLGDYARARLLAEQSLTHPSNSFGIILAQWGLAIAQAGLGEEQAAWASVQTMLQHAERLSWVGAMTWALPIAAVLLAQSRDDERAVEMLALAYFHAASPRGWQERWPRLTQLRNSLAADLGPARFQAAWARGRTLDLAATVAQLLRQSDAATVASPPLAVGLSPTPHPLPAQLTPFVGREQELADLQCELAEDPDTRLITLTGPGGMGKTRLALAVAERVGHAFRQGVCFIPLAPLSAASEIVQAMADSLGLQFYSQGDPQQQLLDYLRPRQMLLIMDNFEHVIAGASLVADILSAAPQIKILITSRERLHLSSERVYTLSGMTFPERASHPHAIEYGAVQLLMQQARLVRPDLDLRSYDLGGMLRICRLVQGMPLALVLAAGWLEVLTFNEIADELERNLDILESQMRDAPERQHSMRAAFDTSWQRLAKADQDAFMRLAVFRGGFTRQAFQSVTEADLRTLRTLVHKSLITVNQAGRYEIHELLRQYAQEKLTASSQATATHDRHLAHFLTLAETAEPHLRGPDQKAWLDQLEEEHDNLRAALRWALETRQIEAGQRLAGGLWWFWDRRGHYNEGRAWLEASLEAQADTRTTEETIWPGKIKAQFGAGVFAWYQTDYQRAIACLQEAMRLAEVMGDAWWQAYAWCRLARVFRRLQDLTSAHVYTEQSLALFRELGDAWGISQPLRDLGWLALAEGDIPTARRHLMEALALRRQAQDWTHVADALIFVGESYWVTGDYAEAETHLSEAIGLCRELHDKAGLATALGRLGFAVLLQGDVGRAAAIFSEALTLRHELGALDGIAEALAGLAGVALAEGKHERAGLILEALAGLCSPIETYLPWTLKSWYDRTAAAAQARLDPARLAFLRTMAQTWSLNRTVAYALDDNAPIL